jgi:hypothetical protein
MQIDPASLSLDQLQMLIRRYQERGLTDRPEYAAYVEAFSRAGAVGLAMDITIAAIRKAAAKRDFLSYGAIAEANGAPWTKVRRLMPKHLDAVLWKCHHFGWPLITAIVVNKQHLATGAMEPESLAGFCDGARRLGLAVTDERAFLEIEQAKTFAWAAT